MLAAAAVGAAIVGVSPQEAAADGEALRYDAFATVSPWSGFSYGSFAAADVVGIVEIGAGGAAARRFGSFDLGLELQYDFGRDGDSGDSMHLGTASFTTALVVPLGAERELRAGVGIGLAYAWLPGQREFVYSDHALGGSAELALAFAQRVRPGGLGLCLQVGLQSGVLWVLGTDSTGYRYVLSQFQLPFVRAGISWR
jgi:hypothetical protein